MRNNKNKIRLLVMISTVVLAIILGVIVESSKADETEELNYGRLITAIQNEEVEKITTTNGSHTFFVYLKTEHESEVEKFENMYVVTVPNVDEFTSFLSEEIKNGSDVKFEVKEPSASASTLVSLLGNLMTIGFLILFMNKMTNGNGVKIAPVYSNVRFEDVAGIDAEREQLEEVVEFLKNPERYREIGARIPKGILVEGDPGTGKTLLAKAIAGEAGVPFFQVNGSSFEEKFVGVGASRVRKLFSEAKKVAPAIIFIDELDSVAQSRYGTKTNYSEQTLNQLLSEMDGFDTRDNVIVIAATNHIEVLDSAVLRPGRFDRKIHIPRPNLHARKKILEVHSRNKLVEYSVNFNEIAKKTVGFSGADLENILNEAAIYAVKQGRNCISVSDIDEAIARVIAGLQSKNPSISKEEKWLTAVHEAGHAVVSEIARPGTTNFGISIIQRGSAGGYNFFDDVGKMYDQKKEMFARLQVFYGGRIAEEIILGDISVGAKSDLEEATKIAHSMVTKYAMNGRLITKIRGEDNFNSEFERETISATEKICQEAFDAAKKILEENKELLLLLAKLLEDKESLSQEEIVEFFAENKAS